MHAFIKAQGPPESTVSLGSKHWDMKAKENGTVTALDCWRLNRIARAAGAPVFKGAGVDLLKKTGDVVKTGEPLYRIYAEIKTDFELAKDMAREDPGVSVG